VAFAGRCSAASSRARLLLLHPRVCLAAGPAPAACLRTPASRAAAPSLDLFLPDLRHLCEGACGSIEGARLLFRASTGWRGAGEGRGAAGQDRGGGVEWGAGVAAVGSP